VTMTGQAPVSAVDPFSDDFLADPFRWPRWPGGPGGWNWPGRRGGG
jgi:hypothetical protein